MAPECQVHSDYFPLGNQPFLNSHVTLVGEGGARAQLKHCFETFVFAEPLNIELKKHLIASREPLVAKY